VPLTSSAIKKARQDTIKTARNRIQKDKMHDSVLGLTKGIAAGKSAAELKTLLSAAQKKLDKAAKQNLINKNTVSRKKSSLSKLVKQASVK
jgi:ribosomal protein S20